MVRYRSNDYSVPVAYAHQDVRVRGYVHEVVIGCGTEVIARHRRSYEKADMISPPAAATRRRSGPPSRIFGASLLQTGTSTRCTTSRCWSRRSAPWIRRRR